MEASGYDFPVLTAHKTKGVILVYGNVIMFTLVSSDFKLSQEILNITYGFLHVCYKPFHRFH